MQEGVLRLSRDRRTSLAAHELLALEPVKLLFHQEPLATSKGGQRTGPEDLPKHGCVLDQLLVGWVQRVEARRDHALHRLRQRQLLPLVELPAASGLDQEPTVLEHADVLLGEERISLGSLEDSRLDLSRKQHLVKQRREERRGLVRRQRRNRHGRRVALAAAPARPAGEQLRTRRRND